MEVECLVSEQCKVFLIEDHVDLEAAKAAFEEYRGVDVPAPWHSYVQCVQTLGSEPVQKWGRECPLDAPDAKAVTLSIVYW